MAFEDLEAHLDVAQLATLVGYASTTVVQEELDRAGFAGLRPSHGYVFQHLIAAPRTIGELATRMRVTQQAASKAIAELVALGYVTRQPDPRDARVRWLQLSSRGRAAVAHARRTRAALQKKLAEKVGARQVAAARRCLWGALELLGAAAAVRSRSLPIPDPET